MNERKEVEFTIVHIGRSSQLGIIVGLLYIIFFFKSDLMVFGMKLTTFYSIFIILALLIIEYGIYYYKSISNYKKSIST